MRAVIDSDTISYVSDPGGRRGTDDGAPQLVLAMESVRPLAPAARFSLAAVDEVSIGRGPERTHKRFRADGRGYLAITVPDVWMSSEHARFVRDADGWRLEDCGSKNGTFVRGARVDSMRLAHGDLIETGSTLFLFRNCGAAVREAADVDAASFDSATPALSTLSPELQRELEALPKIARSGVPMLVLGETGTGKEVIARTVHQLSGRTGTFTPVNCGALPETLIESELFGSKKGAYSGATEDREGLVRASDRGTLFLDEIAELPESSQAALLRVLQENEVLPIGGTRPIKVDIRVIAATHQDLANRVETGRFRKDLYSRLIGFQVTLPPLRARREDIGLLVAALLPRVAGDRAKSIKFQRAAARALFTFDWPLNIRELEHALASAVALADGGEIELAHLPGAMRGEGTAPAPSAVQQRPRLSEEDEVLRERIVELLERHDGNVSAVAREMDKERVQIRRWCKRFAIDLDRYRR